jgi:hypothetical protein
MKNFNWRVLFIEMLDGVLCLAGGVLQQGRRGGIFILNSQVRDVADFRGGL